MFFLSGSLYNLKTQLFEIILKDSEYLANGNALFTNSVH
jgi:hypothetical protein